MVLANLSGFDGSPESMRTLQLEYGAEIGRAIVNFEGPIVFCVISRYHGGAFVVFSKALNPTMTVLALEGSYASVLGGAPAAAVVFSGEVNARTATTPASATWKPASPPPPAPTAPPWPPNSTNSEPQSAPKNSAKWPPNSTASTASNEPSKVGSVDEVIKAADLRPKVIASIEARLGQPAIPLK